MSDARTPAADLLKAYRRGLLDTYEAQIEDLRRALHLHRGAEQTPLEHGGWSPHQVAWHVRAVETQAYLPRLERMLAQDRVELNDFDGDGWMDRNYTTHEAWDRIVDDVRTARAALRAKLEAAPDGAWSHLGRHRYWGSRTLMWWVERSLAHVDEHIAQLSAGSAPAEP